jgi:hypothetical protein
MVFNIVEGIDGRCWLHGKGRNERLAELGSNGVICQQEWKSMPTHGISKATDIVVSSWNCGTRKRR